MAGGKSRTVAFCRRTFWVHADVARGMKQAIDPRGQPDEGEKGKGPKLSLRCRLLDKQRKKEEADAARRAAEERMKAPQPSK